MGRIVHYQSYGTPGGEYLPEPRAAIITEISWPRVEVTQPSGEAVACVGCGEQFVHGRALESEHSQEECDEQFRERVASGEVSPLVGLCVLNPTGQFFNRDVAYAEEPTPGHWNWPPRTEATELRDGGGVVFGVVTPR
ncbi:hypothetical protein OG579_17020 [Williamsia herbipolensis]|uniref:Uncharacterized protein n=1 Tax=Williamsia herbipolensis TaxID=1603258 RepID=A0AAU4K005_9NOCA|nr:hypothetical protein [Williamsia herbipolensis]